MYAKFAKKITNFFINKSIIDTNDREIYEYGYELILSLSMYILIMLTISLIFNSLIESILFFVGFYLYRKIAGGYHADTYLKCHILFGINQMLFIFTLYMYPSAYRYITIVSVCIINIVITIFAAPIDHPNKPFDVKEFNKYNKLSAVFSILLIPVVLIVMLLDKNNVYCFCFSIGVLSANMSLLYAFVERRSQNEKI